MNTTLLFIGFGYTAQHTMTILRNKKHIAFLGTTRSREKIIQYRKKLITLELHTPDNLRSLISQSNAVLISTPPTDSGDDPTLPIIRSTLIKNKDKLDWIGYLSSTSVYGDHVGQWVTETSLTLPSSERSLARLNVENQWLELFSSHQLPVHVFRLAALYGPSRNALQQITNGKKNIVIRDNHVFSRIHVIDLCRALALSLSNPSPGRVFNLADNHPCAHEVVMDYAASLLNRPPLARIPWDNPDVKKTIKRFYRDSKKVSGAAIQKTLNFSLQFPSYKEGLLSLFHGEF